MSMMPAFSPGPCTTSLLRVGSRFKCTREDLYEQCSLHMTEKIPSSVSVGVRPIHFRIRWYSSCVIPCSAITSGVMAGWFSGEVIVFWESPFSHAFTAVHSCALINFLYGSYAHALSREWCLILLGAVIAQREGERSPANRG